MGRKLSDPQAPETFVLSKLRWDEQTILWSL